MNARNPILLVAAGLLLVTSLVPARAQSVKTTITLAELFAAKPGQWVRLEGMPQGDQSVKCSKARLMLGVMRDTDWALKGQIASVDAASRQITVARHKVRFLDAPKYTSPRNTLRGFGDLKSGMYVKVEGTYGKDYGFVARKVDDQSAEVALKPGNERRVLHQGRIDRIDPAKKTIVLMGTTYLVSEDTQVTSVQ